MKDFNLIGNAEIPIKYKISELIDIKFTNISIKKHEDLKKGIEVLELYYNGMYLNDINLSFEYAKKYIILFQILNSSGNVKFEDYFITEFNEINKSIKEKKKEKIAKKKRNIIIKEYMDRVHNLKIPLSPINNIK